MADRDLIIKLAKLANNNPNEHEANAAAKKVCSLLAADEFRCIVATVAPDPTAYYKGGESVISVFEEMLRNMHRNQGAWSSPPRNSAGFNSTRHKSEDEVRTDQSREKQGRQQREAEAKYRADSVKEEKNQKPPDFSAKPDEPHFNADSSNRTKWRPVKIKMKCRICGKEEGTSYLGPEFNFRCNSCRFESFRGL